MKNKKLGGLMNSNRKAHDLELAQFYKKNHPIYSDDSVRIREVWRDDLGILCVRYETENGREIGWFHYQYENGELTWW